MLGIEKHDIAIRRGEVTMIAAEPNDGKSFVSLWCAIQWARLGIRSLYFSADTNERTTIRRAGSCLTGQTGKQIEERIEEGWDEIQPALANLHGGVVFSFETDPTYQDLYEETVAYWEAWGSYPDCIFVDNMMDIVTENENEYAGMRDVSKALKRLARITGAAVIVLHHCNEGGRAKDHPPPRSQITGKVAQKAELILTVQLVDDLREFRVAAVKNRNGFKDPAGIVHVKLRVDLDRCQFYGYNYEKLGADQWLP